MWLCFAFLPTQHIFCSRLILGSLDLFNTTMKLELTSNFATVAETLALHRSTFFQFTLRRAERPTAWLILSLPLALPALYPNSRILTKPPSRRVEAQGEVESLLLEKTPNTKCQLRQQTNAALAFVKTATSGKVCNLILRFSHAVEQSFATAEIANSEASRLRTQLKEDAGQGRKKRKDRKVVSKARVLTVGEGIAMVEEMDQSPGRASLRRLPVTRTSGSGCQAQALAIHATPRRARVRFQAAVTPLSSKSASPANPLTYISICITNTASQDSGPLISPTYPAPHNTTKPPDA